MDSPHPQYQQHIYVNAMATLKWPNKSIFTLEQRTQGTSSSEPVVIVGNSSISSYHPSIVYCKLTQSMSHNAHSVPAWFWRTTMAMLQPVYDFKLCHSKIKLQSCGSPSKCFPCLRLVDMSELASYSLFRAGARHRPTINSNILSIYSTYLTI